MYEERRETFSFKDFLLHLLFIVLIILILILLFAKKNNITKYDEKENRDVNVELSYDEDNFFKRYGYVFGNMNLIKNAALDYYASADLPQKVGRKSKMTLQQFYDQKLIFSLYNKNGDACNASKSYVNVTKLVDDYQMDINLICGEEKKNKTIYIGYYDYCAEKTLCEKRIAESQEEPIVLVLYEYKRVSGGEWGEYGDWTEWSNEEVWNSLEREVEVKRVNEIVAYETKRVKNGTKIETYIERYDEEEYIKEYKKEKYQTGTKTERYVSKTVTKKVAVTKKVKVGSTTKTVTEKVLIDTAYDRVGSGSGKSVPKNTKEYVYKETSSTISRSCSTCEVTTVYTWNKYKVIPIYKTVTKTIEEPIYEVKTVYETKKVPVYATREVPVYATKKVPVYATKKVPVYATREVDAYDEVKTAIYGDVYYYRYRERDYIGGLVDTKWATRKFSDLILIIEGYYLTGNVK